MDIMERGSKTLESQARHDIADLVSGTCGPATVLRIAQGITEPNDPTHLRKAADEVGRDVVIRAIIARARVRPSEKKGSVIKFRAWVLDLDECRVLIVERTVRSKYAAYVKGGVSIRRLP